MSLKVTEPIKIYKHDGAWYYFKTKKPCKIQDQATLDIHFKNNKYVVEEPADKNPIPNKIKYKFPETGVSNSRLVELANENGVKISNKVALKLKETYPNYDESKFETHFRSWGHIFGSVSFSQKKPGQLAFHKKSNK